VQLRTLFETRAGDRLEDDLVAAMDPTTAATLNMYVAGVNAYIHGLQMTSGTEPLGNEYAQLPFPLTPNDLADWTPQDTWALARLQQFQLSESIEEETGFGTAAAAWSAGPLADPGKIFAWIRAAAPPTEQANTLAEGPFTPAVAKPAVAPKTTAMGPWAGQI